MNPHISRCTFARFHLVNLYFRKLDYFRVESRNYCTVAKEKEEFAAGSCTHQWSHAQRSCPQCRIALAGKLKHLSTSVPLTPRLRCEWMAELKITSSSQFSHLLKQCLKQQRDTHRRRRFSNVDKSAVIEYLAQRQSSSRHNTNDLSKRWNISRRQVWHLLAWASAKRKHPSSTITPQKKDFIRQQLENGIKPDSEAYATWSRELNLSISQVRSLVWHFKHAQKQHSISAFSRMVVHQWFQANDPPRRPTTQEYSQLVLDSGLHRAQIQKMIANLMPSVAGKDSNQSSRAISPEHKHMIRQHIVENGDDGSIDYSRLREITGLSLPQLHNQVSYMRKRLIKE